MKNKKTCAFAEQKPGSPNSQKAAPGFEPGNKGFADLCLTTWLWRPNKKAGNETRTRDSHLGKVVLYQLSYSRFQESATKLIAS